MNNRHGLTIRGDSVYCPLAFSLDSFWNCGTDCLNCFLRNLNNIWGKELRPLNPEVLRKKLENGLKNKNPRSPLAYCLSNKKTIRWGNKSDPFQEAERQQRLAPKIFNIFYELDWSFVIQTKHTSLLLEYLEEILQTNKKNLITIMPIISPGLDKDWEVFERKRTTQPTLRLKHCRELIIKGVPVGVNGEPFIPGHHTIKDFEDTLKALRSNGIKRYSTYNFHFNPFVAKRLHAIGVDIEKIWEMNQDEPWKKILKKLLELANKYEILLGCPDFVNTGPNWVEQSNTCCGINVPNPTTFNTHYWKKMVQEGETDPLKILKDTYDGSGDYSQGEAIVKGQPSDFYTLADAGVLKKATKIKDSGGFEVF